MSGTPTLYSYTLRYDDGAAPNPFHGICTLAICKPDIRLAAKVGDWVVGLGSKEANMAGKVIYAMRVTDKMSLAEYDRRAAAEWPGKIPHHDKADPYTHLGDCIYKYIDSTPRLRRGTVHDAGNRKRDLRGKNVLLSNDFYYFGNNPIDLRRDLHPIIHQTQKHKSLINAPYVATFIEWIRERGGVPGELQGLPYLAMQIETGSFTSPATCTSRKKAPKKCRENDTCKRKLPNKSAATSC